LQRAVSNAEPASGASETSILLFARYPNGNVLSGAPDFLKAGSEKHRSPDCSLERQI